ncbi:hypothetical protein ES705_24167 [subsurface metagenome]
MVTSRKKDVTLELLDTLGVEHICISKMRPGMANMACELLIRNWRLWRIAREFKPDVMVARVGVAVGPVGKLMGVPTVVYDDMEHVRLQAAIGMTFATYICTGMGYYRDFGRRHVRFSGPPVMAYLDPKYFTPDLQTLQEAGLDPKERIIFIRIVSWAAMHDVGRNISQPEQLRQMIDKLSAYGRVVVSSEACLPKELRQFENPVPVQRIHDLLAYATLCLVEGGTMAEEAAVLGTPTICLQSYDFGYLIALEKDYELIYHTQSVAEAAERARQLLQKENLRHEWQQKRQKLLVDSEDVVAFQLKMIERAVAEHLGKGKLTSR